MVRPNEFNFIRSIAAPFVPDPDWLDNTTAIPTAAKVDLSALVPNNPQQAATTLELVGIPYDAGGSILTTLRTINMQWVVESLVEIVDKDGTAVILNGNNQSTQFIGWSTRLGFSLGFVFERPKWIPRVTTYTNIDATVARIDMYYRQTAGGF